MYLKAFEDFATQNPQCVIDVHFIDVIQDILDLLIETHKERKKNGRSPDFSVAFDFKSSHKSYDSPHNRGRQGGFGQIRPFDKRGLTEVTFDEANISNSKQCNIGRKHITQNETKNAEKVTQVKKKDTPQYTPVLICCYDKRKAEKIFQCGHGYCIICLPNMRDGCKQCKKQTDKDNKTYNMPENASNTKKDIQNTAEQRCDVCLEDMLEPETFPCQHIFCKTCVEAIRKVKPVCPVCSKPFGIETGSQPEGQMFYKIYKDKSLPGYERQGTIEKAYIFPDGRQQSDHPDPGKPYRGIERRAYLPDKDKDKRGRQGGFGPFDKRGLTEVTFDEANIPNSNIGCENSEQNETKIAEKVTKVKKKDTTQDIPEVSCCYHKRKAKAIFKCGHGFCSICLPNMRNGCKQCKKQTDKDNKTYNMPENASNTKKDIINTAEQRCDVCLEDMLEPETLPCQHTFCKTCVEGMAKVKPVCPVCSKPFGIETGSLPEGQMFYKIYKDKSLPGYERQGTIEKAYIFPDGRQQSDHPDPGKPYRGIERRAYLPDKDKDNRRRQGGFGPFDKKGWTEVTFDEANIPKSKQCNIGRKHITQNETKNAEKVTKVKKKDTTQDTTEVYCCYDQRKAEYILKCGHGYCIICLTNMKDGCKQCKKKTDKDNKTYNMPENASKTKKDIQDTAEQRCDVCLEDMLEPETLPCQHTFCKTCVEGMAKVKPVCPVCFKPFGIVTGSQPDGQMFYKIYKDKSLPGYEKQGTIEIAYLFPDGRQQSDHPEPGKPYRGIERHAYLPDNDKGRKVLGMLKIAFLRRLTFTIGDSRTTGQKGVITWNDIHHKTTFQTDRSFGYPDSGYLDRVTEELAAKGITE